MLSRAAVVRVIILLLTLTVYVKVTWFSSLFLFPVVRRTIPVVVAVHGTSVVLLTIRARTSVFGQAVFHHLNPFLF